MKSEILEPTEKKKDRFRNYLSGLFDIRSDMVSNEELHKMMEENTVTAPCL